jgi:hypothetical protein
MSKCARETCVFLNDRNSEYCCAGCQATGAHGVACEGIEPSSLSTTAKYSTPDANLPGPAFDLARCTGSVNQDGSASVTIAWSPVAGATSYKVLKGGNSPIVLNAMYLNTFLDQAGCFESDAKHLTLGVDEYLTTNTTYSFSISSTVITDLRTNQSNSTNCRINLSFSVYSYSGNLRGPIPYGVLLVDIIFPTVVTTPAPGMSQQGKIVAQVRPNITVSLKPTTLTNISEVGLTKYEYVNHYNDSKVIKTITGIPSDGGTDAGGTYNYINNNSMNDIGAIENKMLYDVI